MCVFSGSVVGGWGGLAHNNAKLEFINKGVGRLIKCDYLVTSPRLQGAHAAYAPLPLRGRERGCSAFIIGGGAGALPQTTPTTNNNERLVTVNLWLFHFSVFIAEINKVGTDSKKFGNM